MAKFNLEGFAHFLLHEMTPNIRDAQKVALEAMCQIVSQEAKDAIGTYKYGWPQLAESTQREREAEGYPANEPLLRDGRLRDSIDYTVINSRRAIVGSNANLAVWQELGTRTIPPRSFLMNAALHKGQEAANVAGLIIGEAAANVAAYRLAGKFLKAFVHIASHLMNETLSDKRRKKH